MSEVRASFSVGEAVRVVSRNGESSNVGMITYHNDSERYGEPCFDILYSQVNVFVKSLEENDVSTSRLRKLEKFESDNWSLDKDLALLTSANTTASEITFRKFDIDTAVQYVNCLNNAKECANCLFGLKDFVSAESVYRGIVTAIAKYNPLEVGAAVIVLPSVTAASSAVMSYAKRSLLSYRLGTISSSENGSFDVMLDSDSEDGDIEDDEEEVGVPPGRLVVIDSLAQCAAAKPSAAVSLNGMWIHLRCHDVLRAVYINLCRCALKLSRPSHAVRYASLSLTLIQLLERLSMETRGTDTAPEAIASLVTSERLRKCAADVLLIRARALLSINRPKMASNDAARLKAIDEQRGEGLQGEVLNFLKKRQKDDRRLARHVGQWVDEAMQLSEAARRKQHTHNAAEEGAVESELIDELGVQEEIDYDDDDSEISKKQPHQQQRHVAEVNEVSESEQQTECSIC